MKIAQVINSLDTGGAEKLTLELSCQIQNKFSKLDIIVLKKSKSIFDLNGLNIIYLGDNILYNPIYIFKLIKHLRQYDLIHAHLFPTLYWVVIAKILSFPKPKLIYTEHSTSNKRRHNFFFQLADRIMYSFVDRIICITKSSKKALGMHLNRTNKMIVINNSIRLEDYKDVNNNFKFFQENFRLIQISSFRKQKDQMTLLKAMNLLPETITLILVGDGQLKSQHEKYVNEHGLEGRVIFLGNRKDIPELLNYCDVVIQSSHYEGFGLTAVEGMAAGKPVIASNVDGLNEVIKDYGLLFQKGNYEELANLILKLQSDRLFYKKIMKRCQNRSKDFSIEKMAEDYLVLYEEVLND